MDLLDHLLTIKQEQSSAIYIIGSIAIIVIYLVLVHMLRFRYINALRRKYPDPTLPLRDSRVAEEVFNTTFRYDFQFLGRLSLELALFKTYSVPTISKILAATGEFSKDAAKRAEDTALILSELIDPYAHIEIEKRNHPHADVDKIEAEQRGRAKTAIERLNEIHGKYQILNGDYLYTLSLFVNQPMKWINRYGWRKLDPLEENAIYRIWYDIGTEMKIKNIPESLDAMNAFQLQYMHDNVRYAPSNWKVAQPTVEHLLSIYPRFLHGIVYKLIPSLLDPLDVEAFGLAPASKHMSGMVDRGLLLQAWIVRHIMLPRFKPILRTSTKPNEKTNRYKVLFDIYKPVYPDGYCIYELGPEKFKPVKCPIAH